MWQLALTYMVFLSVSQPAQQAILENGAPCFIQMSDSFLAYKLCPGPASLPAGLSWLLVHLLCRVGCLLLQGMPKMRDVPCERAICGNLRLRTRREESPEKLPCYEAQRKGLGRRLLLYRLNEGKKIPSTAVFVLLYASEFFLVLK